ncbi:MAG: glycoside hydrolase family 9 protein [Ruminococcus sp.]|nr:glycoside hydrolase family 9 protein [Ruminococcus sp.]
MKEYNERSVVKMHKTIKKIKSTIVSGLLAVTAVASPVVAPVVTQSPSLTATAADNDNYARLLQYSLYFYDANMCGNNSDCALSWRSNCHTTDEVPGGFHDAGDHAMFGLPQGFTASTLGWSYYEFKDAFTGTGQADHLKVITDKFCKFFKDSTKLSGGNVTNFLYQKGDGTADHSYWGPPEQQGSRKMFWTSSGASDVAAEYAAALAANYKNFGNEEDLTYAKALYKFSKQYNQPVGEGHKGFYNSNSVNDDQAWAAGWLYLATNDNSYLNDLKSGLPKVGWVHGWNDTHLGAACLYGEITGDWSAANGFMAGKASGSNYMFLDKWGSARLNCSMQMTSLIATKNGGGNYKDWAKGQMNYILGSNPANTCFVTGFASNSAKNAHHRAASGYTSYEQFNMNGWDPDGDHMQPFCAYGPNSHTLIGALVGGPCNASGSYHDNMADYICNEVAVDYNAGLVGAAAGLYHFYQTGSIDNSITGVTKIYKGNSTPDPDPKTTTTTTKNNPGQVTTTTTKADPGPGGNDIVLLPEDMANVGTEKGDDGKINNFVEFAPQGATSATLYVKVNSSDTEIAGEFGTWTGEWLEDKFDKVKVGSDKIATVDYTIPSNVGSVVKAIVWWPHGDDVEIQKVVLHKGGSSSVTTTTKKTTTTTTTTKKTTTTSTTTTTTTTKPITTTDGTTPGLKAPFYGDADCSNQVKMNDAVLVMQSISNADKYGENGTDSTHITPQGALNADCYAPGTKLTPKDAYAIQIYLLGGTQLPMWS